MCYVGATCAGTTTCRRSLSERTCERFVDEGNIGQDSGVLRYFLASPTNSHSGTFSIAFGYGRQW